jgi:hypothetical protein
LKKIVRRLEIYGEAFFEAIVEPIAKAIIHTIVDAGIVA